VARTPLVTLGGSAVNASSVGRFDATSTKAALHFASQKYRNTPPMIAT
jgi:hypothetical protein